MKIHMTHEEKISYMKVAAGIIGYNFHVQDLDMLVSIYDKILQKKGDTDLKDLVDIQIKIERKYKEVELKNKKPVMT
jgi:hypothetical protein